MPVLALHSCLLPTAVVPCTARRLLTPRALPSHACLSSCVPAAAAVFTGLSSLQSAAAAGSAADAKRGFVATVVALQKWAEDANVKADLKGL